jgi:uncharacterized protein
VYEARPLELPSLPVAEAAREVEALLAADGLDRAGAVDELLAFTQGRPQRTVLLAHHLYNLLDGGAAADALAEAVNLALAETGDSHQTVWDGLSRVQRVVVVTLAGGGAPSGSRAASEHRVARSTLQDALARPLAGEQHVRRDESGRPRLLDPLFAEWLRRR